MLDLENVNTSFEDAKSSLISKGDELGVDVKIQRSEIFNAMHTL
jgi:ACT domain-containing protein